MKQIFLFLFLSYFPLTAISQVGINTKNIASSTVFHLDGKGDNSAIPTTTQIQNDVVVTTNGQIGIGNLNPTAKVEIITNGNGFRLADGSEGDGKFLKSDMNGVAKWESALNTRLSWDTDRKFTIPHTGIYLITLYFDDNNTTDAYINKWINPPRDNGTTSNSVGLYSETRGYYLISNANSSPNYGVSCSGTLILNIGEVVKAGFLGWNPGSTPILGIEIIPL